MGDNGWLRVPYRIDGMPDSLLLYSFYLSQAMSMDDELRAQGSAELTSEMRAVAIASQNGIYALVIVEP